MIKNKISQVNAYRPDVDGLRAVAILLVVTYHYFPVLLPGGFIGVDVFFVISGYLIFSIIMVQKENNNFNIAEFIKRRVLRLFPALAVIFFLLLVVGWLLLLPIEYEQLGKHIRDGSAFALNYTLLSEVGYFDSASDTKILLHLWSLAVEGQFYLFFVLLVVAITFLRIEIHYALVLLLAFSFVLNILESPNDNSSAFYMPQTRLWEFLSGALVAHFSKQLNRSFESRLYIQNILSFGSFLNCVGRS